MEEEGNSRRAPSSPFTPGKSSFLIRKTELRCAWWKPPVLLMRAQSLKPGLSLFLGCFELLSDLHEACGDLLTSGSLSQLSVGSLIHTLYQTIYFH